MTDIYLVRHGEAAASWGQEADPGLSELGHQQAQATAQELLPLVTPEVHLISSPLKRARETAVPLMTLLDAQEPVIEAAFSEVPSPVPLAERQVWLREFMSQTWEGQPESLLHWRREILDSLLGLEQSTVVFTHFLVLNAVVGSLQGNANTLCFWPDNAAVVRLKHAGDALQLVDLGREMSTRVN